jgi:hypothetical protein
MNINDLLKTNVNEHTEKKNGLTYLSWAWAWAEALKADPAATFKVEMFGDKCYMEINGTAMVWVTVTLFGKPMTCQLPVMDSSNKAIPLAGYTAVNKYGKEYRVECDAFAVNTAIMRCMTKALSLHGLGLYIYAGEDIPEEDAKPVKEEAKPQVKEEVKLESKRTVPAKIEGHEMGWQIKLTMPQDDSNEWVDLLKTSTRILFDTAKGQKDITDIFKVNRNIYDHLKSINPEEHKSLMAEFAKAKSLFKE